MLMVRMGVADSPEFRRTRDVLAPWPFAPSTPCAPGDPMSVVVPSWFKYRQGKAEPAGDNLLKLTGPNMGEAYVGIRAVDGGWQGFARARPDSDEVAGTAGAFADVTDAWGAAFELFRNHFIA